VDLNLNTSDRPLQIFDAHKSSNTKLFRQYAIITKKTDPRPAIMDIFYLKKQSEAAGVSSLGENIPG